MAKKEFKLKSKAIKHVYKQIEGFASNAQLILLVGEPGLGKEFAAIHYYKTYKRTVNPHANFIKIDCSKSQKSLYKEIYHEIYDKRIGDVIFLDNIQHLDENIQSMLLEYTAIFVEYQAAFHSSKSRFIKETNVVICSTTSIGNALTEFLLYRYGAHMYMPSLIEREEDLDSAVEFFIYEEFIRAFNYETLAIDKTILGGIERENYLNTFAQNCSKKIAGIILDYKLPHNFRTLRNIIKNTICLLPPFTTSKELYSAFANQFEIEIEKLGIKKNKFSTLPILDIHIENSTMYESLLRIFPNKERFILINIATFLIKNESYDFKIETFLNAYHIPKKEKKTYQNMFKTIKDNNIIRLKGKGIYEVISESIS